LESRILLSDTPPERFVRPIVGDEGVDWALSAYFDEDPGPGASDYRGRKYTMDGMKDTHFAIADRAAMDRGVDALAAAGGTVVETHDGEYDRVVTGLEPPPVPEPDNYVLIDHGGGWRTRYGRLRNGSVGVTPGQVVTPGQKIGQVGGSGMSTPGDYWEGATTMVFTVTHNGEPVDPFADPVAFWQSPPAHAGDTPGVWYISTNTDLPDPSTEEWWEHASRRHVFHPGERVSAWIPVHGFNQGRHSLIRFLRPDGGVFSVNDSAAPADRPFNWRTHQITLPTNAPLGEWKIEFQVDGVALGTDTFTVAPRAEGRPEIKLYTGTTYVIDGRTTPIDFGRVNQGGRAPLTFSLQNFGTRSLTISGVTVPDGFSVVEPLPTSIPAGSSHPLTLQLDDRFQTDRSGAGIRSGRVTIHSDDAEEGEFDFAVTGTVVAAPAPVVTALHVSGGAWAAAFSQSLATHGAGSADVGFAVPGGAAQPVPLPWANLDRVALTFSQDVRVDAADLTVRGAAGAYPLDASAFAYDAASRTATWRLAPGSSFGADRVTIDLDGDGPDGVRNGFGTYLDGNWTNPGGAASPSTFPSGDGSPGGDFRLALNVLPGDVNRSGMVLADDFSAVKKKFFSSPSSPGSGDAAYSVFHDIDGSGMILANDFSEVKKRFFSELPAPAPPAAQAAPSPVFAEAPILTRTSRPPRRALLGDAEPALPG
jgi:hypothetical protein